jgi:arylsulfatase A-like enzyme
MRWAPLGFSRDYDDFLEYMEENRDRPWLYLAMPYPTHLPYDPPQEYYEMFVDPEFNPSSAALERLDIVRTRMILHPPDVISAMEAGRQDPIGEGDDAHKRSTAVVEFEPEDAPGIYALYDGELRVFDDLVGQWLAKLEELDLLDETLIVITSDHGEELLERGHVGHTSCNLKGTLYDECLRVPLIMRYPKKLPAGQVVSQQVSQIDLLPTIFDLLGLELSLAHDGSSTMPLVLGQTEQFREEAYAETMPAGWQALEGDERRIWCVRTAECKLILNWDRATDAKSYELYNLRDDPGERRNVFAEEPLKAAELNAKLEAHMARR